MTVEFKPELLAWTVRHDAVAFRWRALSDSRTAGRVARIYRTLSLIHGALSSRRTIRKRAVFYADVQLFGAQAASDLALLDCAAMLCVPPSRLGVLASPRGLVRGALLLGDVDCSAAAQMIPAAGDGVPRLVVGEDVRFVLVVEKEVRAARHLGAFF